MNRVELKKQAKAGLKGNWGVAILTILIVAAITGVASATVIGGFIVAGPLAVGACIIFSTIAKGEKAELEKVFGGFSNFGNTCVTGFLYTIFLALWNLIPIVGIIKSYSYAMTFFIMKDNPEMRETEAITASRKMMDGHKLDLFILDLSFIGWLILCALTFGLLSFYVAPYMEATRAAFYEKLKASNEQ